MAKTITVEYIRKDAFIEKACEYMRSHIDQQLTIYHEQTWKKRDEFIEDFKRYMGELRNALQEEPVSEDLEEAAIEYCGGHKGADARVRAGFLTGAMWQKENLWKPADGDDLPQIDKEVIVLTQPYPLENSEYVVSFAHRPNPNGFDGKSVTTGETEHYTPKTYDKGGWNQPDVRWWLGVEFPKE